MRFIMTGTYGIMPRGASVASALRKVDRSCRPGRRPARDPRVLRNRSGWRWDGDRLPPRAVRLRLSRRDSPTSRRRSRAFGWVWRLLVDAMRPTRPKTSASLLQELAGGLHLREGNQ